MSVTLIQFTAWFFSINEAQLPEDIDLDEEVFNSLSTRIQQNLTLPANNPAQTNEGNREGELITSIASNEQSKHVLYFLTHCKSEWENLQRRVNPPSLYLIALAYSISRCEPQYSKILNKMDALLSANNRLNRDAISNLLSLAILYNKLDVVKKVILLPSAKRPGTKAVSEAVKEAVRCGKWLIVEALCESENKPNAEAISLALEESICRGRSETVQKLCKVLVSLPNSGNAISRVLMWAASKGSWHIVQMLCELYKDRLDSKAVSSVLKRAATEGRWDIVQILCELCKDRFNSEGLDSDAVSLALKNAADAHQWVVAGMLCALPAVLNKKEFSSTLWTAVHNRQWDLIAVLVEVLSNSPALFDRTSVSYALFESAGQGQVQIVQKLCGWLLQDLSANVIWLSLREAVRSNHLKVVEIFCGLSPEILTNEAVSRAFGLALTERNWESAKRLYQLLPERIVLRREDSSSAIEGAVRADQKDIVQILLGLPAKSLPKESVLQALKLAATNNNWNILEQLCAYTLRNYNEPSRSKFLELTRKHPPSADQQFIRLDKIFTLYESINKLRDYGEKISKSRMQDGSSTKIIANHLKTYANKFVASVLSGGSSSEIQTFRQKLEEARNQMGNHYFPVAVILKNIVVALTGIGGLFIYKNFKKKHSLLFSDTNRQVRLDEIGKAFSDCEGTLTNSVR
jgi:hypothetical protein